MSTREKGSVPPPLTDIRVLELCEGVAGPSAAAYLGDLGALVVKVESPKGDRARGQAAFAAFNRGKSSVICDLDRAQDRRLLTSAARGADIVLIDEDWLRALGSAGIDPKALVEGGSATLVTLPQLGDQTGREFPVDDDAIAAATGLMWVQSGYEDGPTRYVFPALAIFSGMIAAAGCAAGLLARERNGRSPRIEVSQLAVSTLLVGMVGTSSKGPGGGGLSMRWRSPLGQNQAYRCFKTSDGWVCVACTSPDFYNRFCLALDLPELITDPRFERAPWAVPSEHQPAQAELLEPRFASLTVAECLALFEEFDVPAQPVQGFDEFLQGGVVADNEILVPAGNGRSVRFPGDVGGFRQTTNTPAPALGSGGSLQDLGWLPRWLQSTTQSEGDETSAPLAGLRVVDFTTYLAGPICGTLLSDLGADVIKVETPAGEGLRSSGLSCLGINRGKRGLAIDLHSEPGRMASRTLLRAADVALTGFRPDALMRLGLDPESLLACNPDIVSCSFDGYGEYVPFADRPSFDPLIQALSGQMKLQGEREGSPVFFLISLNDFGAGFIGLLAVLVELWRRTRDGGGSASRITQSAVALHLVGEFVAAREFSQAAPSTDPRGRDALHRLYACADGWVYVHAESDVGTAECLEILGLAVDRVPSDTTSRGELAELLEGKLGTLASKVLQERSTDRLHVVQVGLPFPLRVDDPFFADRGCTWHYAHSFFGDLASAGRAIRIEGDQEPLRAGPWVGEHSREILSEVGCSESEIDEFYSAGIATSPVPDFAPKDAARPSRREDASAPK